MDWNDDIDWADILEKALYALIILVVTWIIARAVRWAITKALGNVSALRRRDEDGRALSDSLGKIASLVVWLFGLIALLSVFEMDRVLAPVSGMLSTMLSYLPNIIGAGFVFFIGYLIAKIARELIKTSLDAAGIDRLGKRFAGAADRVTNEASGTRASGATSGSTVTVDAEAGTTTSGQKTDLASVIANVVFGVILIVVGIAALQILGISSISDPAEQMLSMILNAIPLIIAAALLLGLGYIIAKFVGQILEPMLRSLGTDRALGELGVSAKGTTPSAVITKIAQVAIMLFFAIMAARMLNFPEVTRILNEVLELGGRVLFGAVIIGAGVFIANLIARMMGEGTGATIVRVATIALAVAMGLKYMGIADSIINLAFGAIVVGAAAAAAIAFGLGGRDAAARSLTKLERKAEESTSSSTTPQI